MTSRNRNGIIPTAAEELRHLGVTDDPNIKQITIVESTQDNVLSLDSHLARFGLVLADKEAQSYFNESNNTPANTPAPASLPAVAAPAAIPAPAPIVEGGCEVKIKGDVDKKDDSKEGDDEEDDDEMDEAIAKVQDTLESGFLGTVVEALIIEESLTEDEFEEAINFIAEASDITLTRLMRESYYAENGSADAALIAQEITEALALAKPLSEKRIMSRLVGGVKMRLQKSTSAEKKAARMYYRQNKAKILKSGRMKRKKPSYQRKLARQVAKAISMGTRKESIQAPASPAPALNENRAPLSTPPAPAQTPAAPSPTRQAAQAPTSTASAALNEARQYLSRTPADPLRAELTQIVTESQDMADLFIEAASVLGQARYTDAAHKARTLSRSVEQMLGESANLTADDLNLIRSGKAMLNGQASVMTGELRRFHEAQKK